MTPIVVIGAYLALLLVLGAVSSRAFRGTSGDFLLASRSIGPFLLLMSLFGTTMTAFAMVGSTGKAYTHGIGVYGLMASWSGLVHSACFLLVGVPVWRLGKRHGFTTQAALFADRFESPWLGRVLFLALAALVVPYLLIGLLGAGATVAGVTRGGPFGPDGVPPAATSALVSAVVFGYVFAGGIRAAAWANAFQTFVFVLVGLLAVAAIASSLGGPSAASRAADPSLLARGDRISDLHFLSYGLVPLSVGMFPHLFQHWLTAKEARTFRAAVVLHPVLIALVWVPCVLLGVWASGSLDLPPERANAVLGVVVAKHTGPLLSGLLAAGVLAAIMSSLDSQFLALATMFTHDVVVPAVGRERLTDRQILWLARGFVFVLVLVSWLLSIVSRPAIFDLGVWCFSGFAGLFPIALGALYWRRATRAGAFAAVAAAAGTWTALYLSGGAGGAEEHLVLGVLPVVFVVGAGAAALVLVSLVTRRPSEATLARYFAQKSTGSPDAGATS